MIFEHKIDLMTMMTIHQILQPARNALDMGDSNAHMAELMQMGPVLAFFQTLTCITVVIYVINLYTRAVSSNLEMIMGFVMKRSTNGFTAHFAIQQIQKEVRRR